MKSAVVAVLLCSSLLWARSGQSAPEMLAITNVNVVDTRYGGVSPNLTVVVKNGKIVAIAKVALLETGPHVQIINGAGKYLIPGLWDMNAHVSGTRVSGWNSSSLYSLFLANGVTGVRDLQLAQSKGSAPDTLRPEVVSGDAISSSEKRRTLEDLNEVMLICSSREDELRHKAASSLDDPEEIARQIRESYDPDKAWNFFLDLSNHATWMVPSLVSINASADSDGVENTPLEYLPASEVVPDADEDEPDFAREKRQEAARDMLLVNDMHRAGVQFLAGSNAPGINLVPGFSLLRELELLVKSGFTPLQALQTATFNPALYLAKLDKYGVVEPGHIANLVLLEENPLVDIRNLSKITGVVLKGIYLPQDRLRQMLSRKAPLTTQEVSPAAGARERSR
jgi:hypothetical protein